MPRKKTPYRPSNEPDYTLAETPALFIITGQATYSQVYKVPPALFADIVRSAAKTARNPEACKLALANHDYAEMVDRWHALLVLIEHRCIMPVSRMVVDDRDSRLR